MGSGQNNPSQRPPVAPGGLFLTAHFAVVIPCHNRADLLRRCLASVTRHAPPGTDILVVDDASPGGTAGAAAAEFAGVRALRLRRRAGFCVAANRGIAATSAPFVELLNDDTEVTPGWADAALAAFRDPSVGAVAPLVLQPGPRPHIDSAGDRYYLGGVAGKRGHGAVFTTAPPAGPVFGASASSAFYRRAALERAGLFPESFGSYFEDVDLSFRLRRAGWEVVFEPASRVWHHVGASHGRPRRALLERQSRNEERVFWRNLPAPALRRALPKHLAVLVAKALRRVGEGTFWPFAFGRLRLLGEVPELIRHRRRLRDLGPDADVAVWRVETRYWDRSI